MYREFNKEETKIEEDKLKKDFKNEQKIIKK